MQRATTGSLRRDLVPGEQQRGGSCRDPDAAAGDPVRCRRPSEAPEGIRRDKYQGGGAQGGNEAMQRAAAGILRRDPDAAAGNCPGSGGGSAGIWYQVSSCRK